MIHAIVFSNNSPNLLDIFLNSAKDKAEGLFEFSVLYNTEFDNKESYLSIFNKYNVSSFKEIQNFKEDLLGSISTSDNNLISFFKDTNFFLKQIPENNIEHIMSDQDIFCFSLVLGKNIKHCYYNDVYNVLLNDEEISSNTIKWNWVKHYLDFGRPLELGGGHTFHKKEIYKMFKKWNYDSIETLEKSFDNLDYYPKEFMSSFKNSVLVDVIYKNEDIKSIEKYDFSSLDRIVIEI